MKIKHVDESCSFNSLVSARHQTERGQALTSLAEEEEKKTEMNKSQIHYGLTKKTLKSYLFNLKKIFSFD